MTYALTQDLYIQIRSFLRTLENGCKTCLRRGIGVCDECDIKCAKALGDRMDAGIPNTDNIVDTSLKHRMDIILSQMRKAKCPMLSVEIDMRGCCSKELKSWTLGKLISLGKIKREKNGHRNVYSLVEWKENKEKQNGINKKECTRASRTPGGITADKQCARAAVPRNCPLAEPTVRAEQSS